jgi:hypothetical protein
VSFNVQQSIDLDESRIETILSSLTSNLKVKRLLRTIWGIDKINEKLGSKQRVYMIYVLALKPTPEKVVFDAD